MLKKSSVFICLVSLILINIVSCRPAVDEGRDDQPTPPTPLSRIDEADEGVEETAVATPASTFTLTSSAMTAGGAMPLTYTCDGAGISPPLAWQGAPDTTVGYALAMHHVPGPGDTHWYWVVYDIPVDVESLPAGTTQIGTFGINSVNEQQEYAPPCSQGLGEKLYAITVYALSAMPTFSDPTQVTRDVLLAEIANITIDSASLDVTVSRGEEGNSGVEVGTETAVNTTDDAPSTQTNSPCAADDSFADYSDQVTISCDNDYFYIETETGLPDHDIMDGITAWILRVPIPFAYEDNTAWQIPLEPTWLDSHEATHSRGPLAVAINGVPIYHFDKRPDVDLGDNYVYETRFDTVQQGELDHCGGHAGQGEDYHYHLAPVCLLDDHDLEEPIGYTLGGASIFYGTGADDYYGQGVYSHINNLPAGDLDECNGYQLNNGTYIYYTTNAPPYVVGCHHEQVDWSLQLEPSQMRPLGEFGRDAVEISQLTIDGEVRTLLFRTGTGETNAIIYHPSNVGEGCWDFEFRTNIEAEGTTETHCRN